MGRNPPGSKYDQHIIYHFNSSTLFLVFSVENSYFNEINMIPVIIANLQEDFLLEETVPVFKTGMANKAKTKHSPKKH